MKTIFAVSLMVVTTLFGFSQGTPQLEVRVKNVKEEKGVVRVGLFNTESEFLKKPMTGKVVKATGKEVVVVFSDLKPGDYAISVFHDENENDDLDRNIIGIPKEGFAFGNNAMGSFGPPKFEQAKVTIADKKVTQEIELKYY